MLNFVLFETTDSVIEVLWDVALAFFIVRLAFIYFALTFVSGAAVTCVVYHYPNLLPSVQSEALLAPALLLLSAVWARVVVSHYEIPRVAGFRLATGVVALLFMLGAEVAVGFGLWEGGYGNWLSERVGLGFGGLSAAFALLPAVLMTFEAARPRGVKGNEKTWHGHEEKSIVDAVPTVSVSDKEKRQ